MLQRILLPTDFSEHSQAAVRYACELAERFGAELHVLHVLETHATSTPEFGMGLVLPATAHEPRAAAEKKLEGVIDAGWAANHALCKSIAEGPPSDAINHYARDHAIDLIVISSHGRSGLAKALVGSVADQVVRKAPCPVLVVRRP